MSRLPGLERGSMVDSLGPIDPAVVVGHVHLKVTDLERSITFYREALGLEVMQRMGDAAAFLSAGGYHHHLGLNTWESRGAGPASRRAAGLFHAAFLYPTREALAKAYRRLLTVRVPLEGAANHGVSEALYLRDPDDNGLELYWDRPEDMWPVAPDGSLAMFTHALDLDALLALAPERAR